jgi:NAD(P)-dependent dehydrogenase (short-subunit alcohol dehydrogenase family)
MADGLNGKVALVTGGGSGVDRAVTEAFVGEGMKVGVLEISSEKVEELKELGSDVKAIQGDAIGLEDNKRALSENRRRLRPAGRSRVLRRVVGQSGEDEAHPEGEDGPSLR